MTFYWFFPCQFFISLSFFYRFELRGLLSLWNTMLAMFSIMGAFRTAPELIHVLRNYGLFHSVCVPRWVTSLKAPFNLQLNHLMRHSKSSTMERRGDNKRRAETNRVTSTRAREYACEESADFEWTLKRSDFRDHTKIIRFFSRW